MTGVRRAKTCKSVNSDRSLTATAVSTSQINLAWADNTSNETGFRIERSLDNSTWAEIATVGANVTSFSNTGLNPSTLYYYRVRAWNAVGNSEYSNTASSTTQAVVNIHVGDLDQLSALTSKTRWQTTVTIAVHNPTHAAVSGVTVTGTWSNGASGTGSCTTNANGTCIVSLTNIRTTTTRVTFTVTGLSRSGFAYQSSANHDPDGESNGTTINAIRP